MFSTSHLLVRTVIFILAATISSFKIQTGRQMASFSRRAISNENAVLIQEQFKSISTIAADKTQDGSQLEIIENFLISEGSYLGSSKWKIQQVSSSPTSWCYKCTPLGTGGKPVFLKHSRQDLADINGCNKLRNEFEGMRVFSKYSPKDVPKVLLYDANLGILVSEWLEQYIPLSHFFGFTPIVSEGKVNVPHLEVDSDTCRAMGTIMGRSHARTHKRILTSIQFNHLCKEFNNVESIDLWDRNLFSTTLETLRSGSSQSSINELLAVFNGYDGVSNNQPEGPLSLAVEKLRQSFLENKDSLIHADLHCNNLMITASEGEDDNDSSGRGGDRRSRSFKVINFARCRMGPPGLDLGMFLANSLWYYAGSSDASRRRGIVSGVMAAIDSYKSAFRVQMGGAGGGAGRALLKERQRQHELIKLRQALGLAPNTEGETLDPASQSMSVEDILNQILQDGIGYMGLCGLFMALGDRGVMEDLPLGKMPEMRWGSAATREGYVQQRQMVMSIHALMTYLDSSLTGECASLDRKGLGPDIGQGGSVKGGPSSTGTVTAQSFAAIFQADDKAMANNHMTEFWY